MEAVETPRAVAAAAAVAEQDSKEELLPSQTQACKKSVELLIGEGPAVVIEAAPGNAEISVELRERSSEQEAPANDLAATAVVDRRDDHAEHEHPAKTNGTDIEESGGATKSGDAEAAAGPAEEETPPHGGAARVNGTESEAEAHPDDAPSRLADAERKRRGELDASGASEAGDVGFKKIFKFGGFKFTMKKEKAAQPEPAHLLKVSRGEEAASSGEAARPEPATDGARGAEWSGAEEDIADLEIVDEEEVAEAIAAEAAAGARRTTRADSPEEEGAAPAPAPKKMSGLFSGLRKKAADKPKHEEAADGPAAEDASRRAEVEGKMAELATALEAHDGGEGRAADEPASEGAPDVPGAAGAAAAGEGPESGSPAAERQRSVSAADEPALEAGGDAGKGTAEGTDEQDAAAKAKAKAHEGPLKKFFKGSGLKKLPSLKRRATKERDDGERPAAGGDASGTDGKPAQAPASAEGDDKSEPPAPAKEAEGKAEGAPIAPEGGSAAAARKREGVTAWSSFKKLVTPKRRVKKAAESDTDDEPEEPAADGRPEGGAPAGKPTPLGPGAETDEVKVTVEVHSTVEPTASCAATALVAAAAADAAVEDASEAAAEPEPAVAVSDEAPTDEAASPAAPLATSDAEVADGATPPATAPEDGERRDGSPPPGSNSPAEAEPATGNAGDAPPGGSPRHESAWESFKRLVTPKKKTKGRAEQQQQAAGGGAEAAERAAEELEREIERAARSPTQSPKHEAAKAEGGSSAGWSIKKLFPGMKRRRADANAEGAEADAAASPPGGQAKRAEVHRDTPSVVPLSEFESGELSVQADRLTAVEEAELSVSQDPPPLAAAEVALGVASGTTAPAGRTQDETDEADEPRDAAEVGAADGSAEAAGPAEAAVRTEQPADAPAERSQSGTSNVLRDVTVGDNLAQIKIVVEAPDNETAPEDFDEAPAPDASAAGVSRLPDESRSEGGRRQDGAPGDASGAAPLPDLVTDASAQPLPGEILATDATGHGSQRSECRDGPELDVERAAGRSGRSAEETADDMPAQSVKDAMEAYKIPLDSMVIQAPHSQDLEVIMEEDTESAPASGARGDASPPRVPRAADETGGEGGPAKAKAAENERTAAAANSARSSGELGAGLENDHGQGPPVNHDGSNHSGELPGGRAPLDGASAQGDKASEITGKAIPGGGSAGAVAADGVETLSQQKRADGPISENNGPQDLSSAVQMDKAHQLLENSLGNSNSKDSAAQAETPADRAQEKPALSEGGLLTADPQSSVS